MTKEKAKPPAWRQPAGPRSSAVSCVTVAFANGNTARLVMAGTGVAASSILDELELSPLDGVVVVIGGAASLDATLESGLAALLTIGVARAVSCARILIVDGGTESGAMKLVGRAVAATGHASALLGVAPRACVTYPGCPAEAGSRSGAVPLDPNHSHFVLVDSAEWGGETDTMYRLIEAAASHIPSVALLIGGGEVARSELQLNLDAGRQTISIWGSGGLADEILSERPVPLVARPHGRALVEEFRIDCKPAELALRLRAVLGLSEASQMDSGGVLV